MKNSHFPVRLDILPTIARGLLWTVLMAPVSGYGLTYLIPPSGNVIGQVEVIRSKWGDTLPTIGRRYSIGGEEMFVANPTLDYWQPGVGSSITIPSQFILPDAPREGIVVNMAEMRLYYYHPDGQRVSTFPVGIGKEGWQTPMGKTKIVRKRENPTWVVPESILKDRRENNMTVFREMPPGPKNPLGKYAMNLGFKNIVIHGTPWPLGVGLRRSHGCIQLMPEHIEALYRLVDVNTPVNIIYQPIKVGLFNDQVLLESHAPLPEREFQVEKTAAEQFGDLSTMLQKNLSINWKKVHQLNERQSGIPETVGAIIE